MQSRWGSGARRWAGWALVAAALSIATASARAEPRILRYDHMRAVVADRDAVQRKGASSLRELRFEALGRRFELSLDANQPLTQLLSEKARSASLVLYKGSLNGLAGSWARLAVRGAAIEGMFWDGAELYVIEPPPAEQSNQTGSIVFRLSDVVLDQAEASCASERDAAVTTAADELASLMRELKSQAPLMQSGDARLRLALSAIADRWFLARYADEQDARDALLVRLNNVDGLFSAQLGVEIEVADLHVHSAHSDPLATTTSAGALLKDLARLRKHSPNLRLTGLTHLFTGRDLDGDTVGMAYVDTLCHPEYGVGLTEVRSHSGWRDSLVAAHEIGHNFGASHDGDPHGSCPSTPDGMYLMSASVSGSDRFSQCSLNTMRPRALAASCISAPPPADMTIPAHLGEVRAPLGEPFEWRLDVTNAGGATAARARVEIIAPPAIAIDDAYVIGGSCTSGAGVVFCELGDVPGGAARVVNVTFRSESSGVSSIAARIAADNDANLGNNNGEGVIIVEPETDVGVALQGPENADADAPFDVRITLTNATPVAASNVRVTLTLPAGFRGAAPPALPGGTCMFLASAVECVIAKLDGGVTATGAVTLAASAGGAFSLEARVAGAYIDQQPANDFARHIVRIDAQSAVVDPAAGDKGVASGGGGAASLYLLLALAALMALNRAASRPHGWAARSPGSRRPRRGGVSA